MRSLLRWPLLVPTLLFILYLHVISGLYIADIYNQHFSHTGPAIVFYNLARLLLMGYIFWLIYWAGWITLRAAAGEATVLWVSPAVRLALGFFTGVGAWHILLLLVGLNGGLKLPFAVFITVVPLLMSLPHMARCLHEMQTGLRSLREARVVRRRAACALAVAVGVFIAVKILYPSGWHDYFVHYLPYYNAVVGRGSTIPNEVWYHFFYSKGAGMYFIAMLLSDPLAPSLVAGTFVLAAALIVFLLVSRFAAGTLWPWIACILYLVLQLYIRGAGLGSWGHLPKLHELTAASTLMVVWCAIVLRDSDAPTFRLWGCALLLTLAGAVIITPPMALLYAAFLGLLALLWWRQGHRRWWILALGVVVVMSVMLSIFRINTTLSGVPDDHFTLSMWEKFDLHKIQAWGTLYEWVILYYHRIGLEHITLTIDEVRKMLYRFLRLDLLWPLYVFALLSAVQSWWKKKKRPSFKFSALSSDVEAYLILIIACMAFAVTAGKNEPVSFYRFSSFMFAPMLCLAMFCIHRAGAMGRAWVVVCVAVVCVGLAYSRYRADDIGATFANAARFVSGSYSIDDAVSHQRGLPADAHAEGAIHPAARASWQIAGRKTRIWSFTPYTYCALPGCRMQSYISFRFSPNANRIMFGTAQEAKAILKREGLDYFLISPELEIRDPLPLSALFSPVHIGQHLAVRWTDGHSVLLTWKERPDTKPISKEWLALYKEKIKQSHTINSFPLAGIRTWFDDLKTYKGNALPPLTNP